MEGVRYWRRRSKRRRKGEGVIKSDRVGERCNECAEEGKSICQGHSHTGRLILPHLQLKLILHSSLPISFCWLADNYLLSHQTSSYFILDAPTPFLTFLRDSTNTILTSNHFYVLQSVVLFYFFYFFTIPLIWKLLWRLSNMSTSTAKGWHPLDMSTKCKTYLATHPTS